ncbi:UNVERIFIED_CONTAM: hypothetical protein Sradi_0884000 [Sesamum radiatum]|uniref:Calcineurin-like phosphoesterase domain-containing protein n=1 Tax=Sesamum radiatum TaxID=300843 RepID=A0AAW2V2H1_SESRA
MLNLTLFLCIVWALSLLYGEWFAYLVPSIWTCSWPHQRPSSSSLDGVDYPSKYVKIAVVADPQIVKRYEREFGVRNFKVTLGNVDFIAIDAQTLDGRPQSKLTSATWDFIKNASKDIRSTPRVLLTHIPLYRPDGTPCGPHRSASIINQASAKTLSFALSGYQNYITKSSTNVLLDLIQPSLVLSAHDHDQCTVTHRSKNGPVIEQTVGTVSWQQGNLYPSFMLLSASNSTLSDGSSPENAASSQLCFLPMQTHIYLWYLSLFAMTLVIVLLWPANEVLILRKLGELMGCIRSLYNSFSNTMKEKNEDENCEYEEIWDAEGTMHLIKKKKKVSSVVLNERSSVERGNIVMRSKVRKQTGQETDASTPDESIHVGSARTNKSKAKIMIWRLLRASRAILTIAAFNVPLYVLLVFKDWMDK